MEATLTSPQLQRLARGGELETHAPSRWQFVTLVRLGRSLLQDSRRDSLSLEGRFSLIYGAAQALAAAALGAHGYRSGNRALAFDCLQHTAGITSIQARVLALCHDRRIKAEQLGLLEVDERLVEEADGVVEQVLERLETSKLPS